MSAYDNQRKIHLYLPGKGFEDVPRHGARIMSDLNNIFGIYADALKSGDAANIDRAQSKIRLYEQATAIELSLIQETRLKLELTRSDTRREKRLKIKAEGKTLKLNEIIIGDKAVIMLLREITEYENKSVADTLLALDAMEAEILAEAVENQELLLFLRVSEPVARISVRVPCNQWRMR